MTGHAHDDHPMFIAFCKSPLLQGKEKPHLVIDISLPWFQEAFPNYSPLMSNSLDNPELDLYNMNDS